MTRRCLLVVALVLAFPALSGAQTVYWPDRPIAMPKGEREVNLDLSTGLNRGALGEDFGMAAGLAGDRYSGLHFRAGVFTNFELGLAIQFLYSMHKGEDYTLRPPMKVVEANQGRLGPKSGGTPGDRPARRNPGPEGDGTHRIAGWPYKFGEEDQSHLNPLTIYFKYAFVPQAGLEFALIAPLGSRDGENRPSFRLGIPLKFVLSPGMFSIHIRPDLLIGFGKKGPERGQPKDVVLLSYYGDAGFTFALVGAFIDVSLGYGGDAYPYKRGYLTFSALLGYTILPTWDLYAGVSLDNLVPKAGKPDDARRLTLGTSIRF